MNKNEELALENWLDGITAEFNTYSEKINFKLGAKLGWQVCAELKNKELAALREAVMTGNTFIESLQQRDKVIEQQAAEIEALQ